MRRILGIDPGFAETGWGIIDVSGTRFIHVDHGFIKTLPSSETGYRLNSIFQHIVAVIEEFSPDFAGIEEIFFARNKLSALPVAHAKGVILLALEQKNVKTFAFTPLQIKQTLTGNGRSDKNQVQHMVKLLLGLQDNIKPDHASDALAAAICFQNSTVLEDFKND